MFYKEGNRNSEDLEVVLNTPMSDSDFLYFNELKKALASAFQERHLGNQSPIEQWKGQEIKAFQEDLIKQVNSRISEKWFYTHIKSRNHKLPRVDMLDILSRYSGYKNWTDFKNKQGELDQNQYRNKTKSDRNSYQKIVMGALVIIGLAVVIAMIIKQNDHRYQFCFVEADSGRPITSAIEVSILKKEESPIFLPTDDAGCIKGSTNAKKLQLVVNAPYYQNDTITRTMGKHVEEVVRLRTDDYALMIHYFSHSKVGDWENRRSHLQNIIADRAKIFQLHRDRRRGMEMYNREEFINKLITPIGSLKNIEILDVRYEAGKMVEIRFVQTNTNGL